MIEAEKVRHLPVVGLDGDSVPDRQRLEIARVCREMDRLGCQITRVQRNSDSTDRWDVEWRSKDRRISPVVYGATAATPLATARAALANAQSDLDEAICLEAQSTPL